MEWQGYDQYWVKVVGSGRLTLWNTHILRKFTPATVVIRTSHNLPPQNTKDDTLSTPVTEATDVPNTTSMPHHMIPPAPVAPPPLAPTVEAATLPSMEACSPPPVLPAPQLLVCSLMEAVPPLHHLENHSQCLSRMLPALPNHGPSDTFYPLGVPVE